jgi:hypothetical protein
VLSLPKLSGWLSPTSITHISARSLLSCANDTSGSRMQPFATGATRANITLRRIQRIRVIEPASSTISAPGGTSEVIEKINKFLIFSGRAV